MELKIGSTEKVNFSLFKKRFLFESGDRGLVLEQADGVVCLYATDAAHEKIYCAMPMGRIRDMKKLNYYLFAPDESKLLAAVGGVLFVIDFSCKWAATNLDNYHIYGSEYWGENCQQSWTGKYMLLFGLPDPNADMDRTAAEAFWVWFVENEDKITEKLGGSEAREVVTWVDERICPVFPYTASDMIQFELGWNSGKGEILFFHSGNEKLLADAQEFAAMMPESLKDQWTMAIQA